MAILFHQLGEFLLSLLICLKLIQCLCRIYPSAPSTIPLVSDPLHTYSTPLPILPSAGIVSFSPQSLSPPNTSLSSKDANTPFPALQSAGKNKHPPLAEVTDTPFANGDGDI